MEDKKGLYNALDVARFTINYTWKINKPISNLKLQKILYFIQADYLANTDKGPCFIDEIEAWDFGPVVPSVYHEFKKYVSSFIHKINTYLDMKNGLWDAKMVKYDDKKIEGSDKEIIIDVIKMLVPYSAGRLVEITHRQKPWMDTYQSYCNNIIPKKLIKEYFSKK